MKAVRSGRHRERVSYRRQNSPRGGDGKRGANLVMLGGKQNSLLSGDDSRKRWQMNERHDMLFYTQSFPSCIWQESERRGEWGGRGAVV